MIKMKSDETRKGHALIKVLGIAVLAFIMLVGITGAAPFAYIPNSENSFSVVDTATDKVVETVNIGTSTHGVAINPAGTKVYLVGRNEVSVIDTATNTVIATIPVGSYASSIAINPTGTRVYITNDYATGSVYVIDTADNTVLTTIPVGYYPKGIALSPDGTKIYVGNIYTSGYAYSTVSVIDATTNTVTKTMVVGKTPIGIAFNPAGTKAYTANSKSGTVSVIDTATETVTATVNVGSKPFGIAVSPDGTKVYVTDDVSEGTVSVIDATKNEVTDTIPVGIFPNGVAVNPEGAKVYVINGNSYNVSVIDATTNKLLTSVDVGIFPSSLGQFISPTPSLVPTVTKTIVIIPAKFSDTGSAPSIEDMKKRVDLIVDYYDKQSYGKVKINCEFKNSSESDGWFKLSSSTSQFEDILDKKDYPKRTTFWVEACNLAGVSTYSYDGTHWYTNDYDASLVLFPADFTSQSYPNTGYAICQVTKDYGNWVHELGHALFGLKDEAGIKPEGGSVGRWGLMGTGHQYNPPSSIIGFDKNKIGWLQYKDIGMSNIAASGSEYTIIYLDDSALCDENEGLLRLSTEGLVSKYSAQHFIFEGRRKYDGVTKDISSNENYPLFDSADEGIVIYNVDSNNKIWREMPTISNNMGSVVDHVTGLGNDVTISPGESKYLALYTLKATCLSDGDKLKLNIEPFIPTSYNVWSITTTTAGSLYDSLPSVPDDSNPDVDLHAITSDGRRIGMDYANDTYYNEIEGAETSGNLLGGGPEWIAIPDDIDVTTYVTISPDMKTLLLGSDSSNVEVNSALMVYDEKGDIQESEPVSININFINLADQFPIPLINNNSPASITNLRSTFGSTWINWTWTNPTDPDFNHTEIYLNNIFQTNTSAEFFNATGLEHETDYTIGTRTVDIYGSVSDTWINATATTLKTPLLAFPGYTNPPSDLDQDGIYEDINGNGILDFDDVVAYYDNMDWIEENVPLEFFDYNNNGLIDFDDVVKLYDML